MIGIFFVGGDTGRYRRRKAVVVGLIGMSFERASWVSEVSSGSGGDVGKETCRVKVPSGFGVILRCL